MNIEYVGEHLIFGQIGNILIGIAFAAALLSAIAYFIGTRTLNPELKPVADSWNKLGRISFIVHGISVFGVIGLIFFLIHGHYFEYHYVWQHSSLSMPMQYIFSCFWEGQEGSFLLWTFWHIILAFIIMARAGSWESPVMTIVAMVQVFLVSMIIGIVILGQKIGTNPFILLREHPDMANLPFIKMPDYLSRITDGRGLNPLLQNYWMTIHPPTLFLGFASTVIPFAYAMGALLQRKSHEWVRPAMPWAFFGVMILGTGILMGAAWAYEALSFGGFWAWDPVENASLVPWITLVASAHMMLVYQSRKHYLLPTFLLTIISFILILYSTFLTRSGILGETSVHAFTDLGMTAQLVLYMLFFVVLAVYLLILNRKNILSKTDEESLYSREFWMFTGTLVLLISAFQITFSTSTPVLNKLFGTNMAPPVDAISHYNNWQIPISVIIGILIAVTQFFKYKNTNPSAVLKGILPSFIVSIIVCTMIAISYDGFLAPHLALLFASLFAVFANIDYFFRFIKGKLSVSGAPIAHIGFALILLGSLISNAKREVISRNTLQVDLGKDFPNDENILLRKGDTLSMGKYFVTFAGKQKDGIHIYYEIDYFEHDQVTNSLKKSFSLKPFVQLNERMGNVAEPGTKHFFNKDIYTHITYADLEDLSSKADAEGYKEPVEKSLAIGDTVATSGNLIVLVGLDPNVNKDSLGLGKDDIAVAAQLKIISITNDIHYARPIFMIRDRAVYTNEAEIENSGLKIGFVKIDPETGKIDLAISEKKNSDREFIIMKAIIFPYINILWMGCILLIIGTTIAIRNRIKSSQRLKK